MLWLASLMPATQRCHPPDRGISDCQPQLEVPENKNRCRFAVRKYVFSLSRIPVLCVKT